MFINKNMYKIIDVSEEIVIKKIIVIIVNKRFDCLKNENKVVSI